MNFLLGFVLLSHLCVIQALDCLHYSALKYADTDPCTLEEFESMNKTCNRTTTCSVKPDPTISCYTLWKNDSQGVITIVRQGCWKQIIKCGSNTCIGSAGPKGIIFCCCRDELCNSKFEFQETKEEIPSPEPPKEYDSNDNSTLIVVFTSVSLILLLTFFIGYCLNKRRKRPFDKMEIASVETPFSGITTSTMQTTALPAEINYPELIELKARGRYGCVWKAELQDRFVAVKIFYLQDKNSWQNEKEIYQTDLMHDHPNVLHYIAAPCRGTGVDAELWLITEFHSQGSLTDYLKANTMTLAETLTFIKTMATGLSFLHRDVISRNARCGYKPAIAHRDFKSKNVLVKEDLCACIADFGLAIKFDPGENSGESHGQVGTKRYMAPEVLEGAINFNRDAFLRIDMYAFALVMWEILNRCTDSPGYSTTYVMPYEKELGQNPSLEEMQELVADRKIRPYISTAWRQHEILGILSSTMEDCWDQDAEARLTAGCVEERLGMLITKYTSMAPCPRINSNVITDALPLITSNTNTQNQINKEKNESVQQPFDTSPLLQSSSVTDEANC